MSHQVEFDHHHLKQPRFNVSSQKKKVGKSNKLGKKKKQQKLKSGRQKDWSAVGSPDGVGFR